MQSNPLVSVLMPAYNREQYIGEAIESIIAQTYQYWELIIVDDGSTDRTAEIVRNYQAQDARIVLHQFPENKGIPFARNQCLVLAKGKYLANLDSDDIALPQRLEIQVKFMEENPEIGVCGSSAEGIDKHDKTIRFFNPPKSHNKIVIELLFVGISMINPSIIWRKRLNLYYQEKYLVAQDYDFLIQCLAKKVNLFNLPETLIKYRLSKSSVSHIDYDLQRNHAAEILWRFLNNYCDKPKLKHKKVLIEIIKRINFSNLKKFKERLSWFEYLLKINKKQKLTDSTFLEYYLGKRVFKELCQLTHIGISVFIFYKFRSKKVIKSYKIGYRNQFHFFLDCLLRRKSKYVQS